MNTVGRAAVMVAWVAGLLLLTTWSNSDAAMVAALLVTLLAATLVGRWWVLFVPLVPAAALILGSLASANEADSDGTTGFEWAAYIAVVATLIVLLLAVGVSANRLGVRVWKQRGHRGAGRRR